VIYSALHVDDTRHSLLAIGIIYVIYICKQDHSVDLVELSVALASVQSSQYVPRAAMTCDDDAAVPG